MALLGLLSVAIVGWAVWVFADGADWILELMFQSVSSTTSFSILCSVFGLIAFLSFWGAKRLFPRKGGCRV
jgi:hypothetical protein